jgi:ABC-3C protein
MNKTSKTTQKGNVVLGDMAGGDITHHHYSTNSSPMSRLIQKFHEEEKNNVQFNVTIDKLIQFQSCIDTGNVKGLEEKLSGTAFVSQLDSARRTKELFVKALAKHQFSESAQKIMAHLLADICQRFDLHVWPAIVAGFSSAQVNQMVQQHVIDPVKASLEENVLDFYAEEINGMLYFLTGNCHIKWNP